MNPITDHSPPISVEAQRENRRQLRKLAGSITGGLALAAFFYAALHATHQIEAWADSREPERVQTKPIMSAQFEELVELRMFKADAESWDCTTGPKAPSGAYQYRMCRRIRRDR